MLLFGVIQMLAELTFVVVAHRFELRWSWFVLWLCDMVDVMAAPCLLSMPEREDTNWIFSLTLSFLFYECFSN